MVAPWLGGTDTLTGAFIGTDLIVNTRKSFLGGLVALAFAFLSPPAAATSFNINLSFLGGLTASQERVFERAEAFWEGRIAGYQDGISITGLTISAAGIPVDGEGGFAGLATPMGSVVQNGFTLATFSTMQFDTSDLAALEGNGTLFDVVVREMAHAIGFGTMWSFNGLYVNGSGLYSGANALAAYREEFDPDAEFIPVELNGGLGSADILWAENWAGGPDELMTASVDTPTFISNTTLASLEDIGFLLTVPIPSSILLGLTVLCVFVVIARRKKFRA